MQLSNGYRVPIKTDLKGIRLTVNELESLKLRLLKGDEEAIEPIVLHHMQYAISIAAGYVSRLRHRQNDEELVSVAVLALILGCNRIIRHDYKFLTDLTVFLCYIVHSKCIRYIEKDSIITVPHSTNRMRKKAGTQPIRISVSEITPDYHKKIPKKLIELQETIDSLMLSDVEKVVVKMRVMGYIDREIGDSLGFTESHICGIRARLEIRFNRLNN